ncbi:hypothetical protein HBI69_049100 [Parastagonospora nodorum]|nr:hypothetical protein HBI69_049100 [Parastagonospora nodorum]
MRSKDAPPTASRHVPVVDSHEDMRSRAAPSLQCTNRASNEADLALDIEALRSFDLPSTRRRSLEQTGNMYLRNLAAALTARQSRREIIERLMAVLEKPSPVQLHPTTDEEEMFEDQRKNKLFRRSHLDATSEEALRQLCSYTSSALSNEALLDLNLQLLDASLAKSTQEPQVSTASQRNEADSQELVDVKLDASIFEFDDDAPQDRYHNTSEPKIKRNSMQGRAPKASTNTKRKQPIKCTFKVNKMARPERSRPSAELPLTGSQDGSRPSFSLLRKKPSAISHTLLVPSENELNSKIRSSEELTFHTRSRLELRFQEAYILESGKREAFYETFVRPELRASRANDGGCLNLHAYGRNTAAAFSFSKASGNKERACDRCIRTKRLCVRMTMDGLDYKLCLYPLPSGLRESVDWTEIWFEQPQQPWTMLRHLRDQSFLPSWRPVRLAS